MCYVLVDQFGTNKQTKKKHANNLTRFKVNKLPNFENVLLVKKPPHIKEDDNDFKYK